VAISAASPLEAVCPDSRSWLYSRGRFRRLIVHTLTKFHRDRTIQFEEDIGQSSLLNELVLDVKCIASFL